MDGRDTADDAPSIASEHTIILDLPPSCVEFSPLHPHYFMLGTYCLEPDAETASHTTSLQQHDGQIRRQTQDRRGSLTLFSLTDDVL